MTGTVQRGRKSLSFPSECKTKVRLTRALPLLRCKRFQVSARDPSSGNAVRAWSGQQRKRRHVTGGLDAAEEQQSPAIGYFVADRALFNSASGQRLQLAAR